MRLQNGVDFSAAGRGAVYPSGRLDAIGSRPIVVAGSFAGKARSLTEHGGLDMSALQRFGTFPLYISTPIAAIVAAIVAGVAHLIIGDLAGGIPDGFKIDTPTGKQELVFASSMLSTFLYTIIGGVVYAIVRRFSGNPDRTFVIVAVVATLLSFLQPITVDAPGKVTATLIVLHIIAAIVATPLLIGLTRPKAEQRLQET